MKIDTVAQLLDPGRVSNGLIDDALRQGAPFATNLCQTLGSPLRPDHLRAALVAALPSALQVGLRECICHRWWPAQDASGAAPIFIEWTLYPTLEWLFKGWPTIALTLAATVRLQQEPLTICHDAAGGTLRIGEDRRWLARITLSIADLNAPIPAVQFFEGHADVHVDCGPWPLASF
jgi:hypothetical protein